MSKKRRRSGRRRQSSCCSTQAISPNGFSIRVKSPLDDMTQEDNAAEKGVTDSLCKEYVLWDEEEKETEPSNKEDDNADASKDKVKNANISVIFDQDKRLRITHSVTVDDFGRPTPKLVFQHSSGPEGEPSGFKISLTTSKSTGSMILEMSEMMSDCQSDMKTTIILQNQNAVEADICFSGQGTQTSHKETFSSPYFRENRQKSFDINITKLDANRASPSNLSSLSSRGETDCCKSCCKDHRCCAAEDADTDFTLVDGSSTCSSPSSIWHLQRKPSLLDSLSHKPLLAIPPPLEFADQGSIKLQSLTENTQSCQINGSKAFNKHGDSWKLLKQETLENWNTESLSQLQLSDLHDFDSTKYFFDNQNHCQSPSSPWNIDNKKKPLINSSASTLEALSDSAGFMIPSRRRRTFPGLMYQSDECQRNTSSCRGSFSSGALSSFFMQSLPYQAERATRFYLEDDRLGFSKRGSRTFSNGSYYQPSLSSSCSPETILPHIKAYSTTKNPFYPSASDDTSEEVFLKCGNDQMDSIEGEDRGEQKSFSRSDPLEQSDGTEGGFDEELEENSSEAFKKVMQQKGLLIHITPPSPYNSEEHINEGGPKKPEPHKPEEVTQMKRKSSVVTIQLAAYEQRVLNTSKSEDPVQKHQTKADMESGSDDQTEQLDVHVVTEESQQFSHSSSKSTFSSSQKTRGQTWKHQNNPRTLRSFRSDSVEGQSTNKSLAETKVHLKPPGDCMTKDSEETSDHWAKKRRLFKESRQWGSGEGSSMTSNITDESDTVNSEDAHSVDMSLQNIEDRGFYTETFHSASWLYRGENANPNESAPCLSNRPRPVAVRDRTVKISKGVGEYPWGFRIQFSKPIIVTEVDTNGAAEEAGLKVGDYVLAVNGTDVTSVPHSEAVDLARQGPDLLILTIGSDIGQIPNTPRPACRGYLHKRTHSSLLRGWRKRWFVLKHDCCLYYYRNKRDEGKSHAMTAMRLEGAVVETDSSLGKPFVFKCSPVGENRVYYFCATSNQEMRRWLGAMEQAIHPITQNHVWVDVTRHNSNLPPLAVKNPESLGLLNLLDKNKDSWVQHYCILKDGCLYFYTSIRSTHAIGGIYLHGYTVREQSLGFKRSTIELKPPSEEFKVFYLCAENVNENKRWIGAIKASIGKWLPFHQALQDYMSRPPEETKM